jgi:hypothetical protein
MRDLANGQGRTRAKVGPPAYRVHRRRRRFLHETSRPLPLAFDPEAFEAERVIAVGPNAAAMLESGLPFAAPLAGAPDFLRLTVRSARHGVSSRRHHRRQP